MHGISFICVSRLKVALFYGAGLLSPIGNIVKVRFPSAYFLWMTQGHERKAPRLGRKMGKAMSDSVTIFHMGSAGKNNEGACVARLGSIIGHGAIP